eukprot:105563-Prorocentrum_lima.AAC.1
MTSSLVGSEMCIRDSPSPRLYYGMQVGKHAIQKGAPVCCALLVPCTGEAVSYTHLTLPTICSV